MNCKKTPGLDDTSIEDVQSFGETVKNLKENDIVRVTNSRMDFYIEGRVIKTRKQLNGEEYYDSIIKFGHKKAEIHANWRDIPEEADDQETPYTGLIIEPFNDTAPPITDISVVNPKNKETPISEINL